MKLVCSTCEQVTPATSWRLTTDARGVEWRRCPQCLTWTTEKLEELMA